MLNSIIHVNSKGHVLNFHQLGIYVNYNDLHDYDWSYTSTNNRINGFAKGIASKTIPLVFACNQDEAIQIKNSVYEHFDIDVLNQKYGYFQIGEYKFYCYVIKSVKARYDVSKRYLELSLSIVTDKPFWYKETSYALPMQTTEQTQTETNDIKKYTYHYPYKYSSLRNAQVIDSGFSYSDLVIRFFGYCENPYVNINGKIYKVNYTCENGEYIEINTVDRTVIKVSIDGTQTNIFNYRDKTVSNFFEKLNPGLNQVMWDGNYAVEIVVVESRSEPKWS